MFVSMASERYLVALSYIAAVQIGIDCLWCTIVSSVGSLSQSSQDLQKVTASVVLEIRNNARLQGSVGPTNVAADTLHACPMAFGFNFADL